MDSNGSAAAIRQSLTAKDFCGRLMPGSIARPWAPERRRMSNKKRKGKAARAARNRRKREKGTEGIRQAAVGYRDTYANNWTYHSESYRSGGHYEWMAGVLHQYDRILEVGTGDGSGTAALFRSGATILSIDNNPSCHDLAEARLQEHGIPLKRERRGTLNPGAKTFNISYRTPQSELIEGQVLLLEGDVGRHPRHGLLLPTLWTSILAANRDFSAV